MRKLVISMNLSLDGMLSGPAGELDWHLQCWDEEMSEKFQIQLDQADTILLGRMTYEAMSSYWGNGSSQNDLARQDYALALQLGQKKKIVFSKTKRAVRADNTRFFSADLTVEIQHLKNLDGKDILLMGSRTLGQSLLQTNLVDEYIFWIHPVILGKGIPFFKRQPPKKQLQLRAVSVLCSGVVQLCYQVCKIKKLPCEGQPVAKDRG